MKGTVYAFFHDDCFGSVDYALFGGDEVATLINRRSSLLAL